MITIQEVRAKYPQYNDLSDKELVDSLHGKYYSDIPINEFYQKVGLGQDIAPQPKLTKAQTALDVAKSVGSGGYTGLSYIPGFIGDIEKLGQQYLPSIMTRPIAEIFTGKEVQPTQVFPTSKEIRGYAEQAVPALRGVSEYQPETAYGRYAKTMAEFAAPAITGKTKAARRFGSALGLGGGALYETVEEATKDPLAATAVTLPTMLTAGLLAGPSKAAKLAERSLKGVSEKEIADAIGLENAAKLAGVKLLPGETLDNKMIASLTEDVMKSDMGSAYIYEAIKNRPKEVETLINKQANKIADLPESQRAVFKMISDTAKTSIKTARKTRTNKAQEAGYKVADTETLPPETILDIIDGIDSIPVPPNSPSARKLQGIKKQLTKEVIRDEKTKEIIEIIPETNINNLSSTYKQFKADIDASNKELVTGGERFIVQDLRPKLYNADETGALDLLGSALNSNPAYKAGNDKFAELTNSLVKVVEENLLTLSKKNIDLPKIEKFIFDQKAANKKDINDTLSLLNKTNPQATIEIANAYFRNAINDSIGINRKGPEFTQGFNFVEAVIGKKGKKRENFLAVIDNVADAQKVSRKDLKVGFENMLNILERTSRISNINKPGFDVQGIAKQTLAKDLAMAKTFNPLVRLSTKYSELRADRALDNLGRVLANPNSTKLLVELGRTNPTSKAAIRKTLQIIDTVSPLVERQQPTEQPQVAIPAR
ncbi:hypothetical protein N9Y18_06395 [Litoricolaceae bacterium]|nr:hypothetical protein [Litorivicinaceae bacterium]